jgi:hypothetical protein
MAPTFWQFVRERWGRILLGTSAWTVACVVVNVYCPCWARWVLQATACCWLSYQWGGIHERRQCSKELLEARDRHCADLDRFVAYLAEERGYWSRMQVMVGKDKPKEQAN